MPINVDMVTFMNHVRTANSHMDFNAGSLVPLIALLGGIPPPGTLAGSPAALRIRNEDPILDLVMGAEGGPAGLPLAKRRKYRNALGYLFGLMNLPLPNPAAALRYVVKNTREFKQHWAAGVTGAAHQFVHCSNVTPQTIHAAGGFNPQHASEFCTPNTVFLPAPPAAWPTHEFTFFLPRRRNMGGGGGWAPVQPPAGGGRFGFGNFIYLLRPPAGTVIWNAGGAVAGGEIAFPQVVPLAHLIPYSWNNTTRVATQRTWTGAVATAIIAV